MPFQLTAHGLTDIGCVRARNEDAFSIRETPALLAVADGMGGHDSGDLASRTVVAMLEQVTASSDIDALAEDADTHLILANRVLIEEAQERGGDVIGTTIVCVVAVGEEACVLWAGDSRAYHWRDDRLEQLTEDHNVAAEMVASGRLTHEEARMHPASHRITCAVGLNAGIKPQRRAFDLRQGDRLLLCSDGLTGCLGDEEIATILSDHDDERACNALLRACIAEGAPDNVTVLCATMQS